MRGDIMNNYIVYTHISPSNKRYIGITSQKINRRWRGGKGYENNIHFTNAINKYGWDNFQHIIIAKGLTQNEAEWLEVELIREWDTTNINKGYNVNLGGELKSQKVLEKISNSLKESEKMKKVIENNKITIICLTTKRIFKSIKDASIFYHIESSRNAISLVCKGERKYAGVLNGKPLIWRYLVYEHNYKFKVKERKKIEINNECKLASNTKKKIVCLNNNKIYDSYTQCQNELGINRKRISECCNNKREFVTKNNINYFFKFVDK